MPTIVRGIVRGGVIEPSEPLVVADGTEVLVAVPDAEEPDDALWRQASQESLRRAWVSPEDDVYDALSEA
jgi:predicted DNA-binding antitoxin AbrB/MazE fold protein